VLATTKITPPDFKPKDLVTTPTGRLAKILEVLPYSERLVEFLEGERGEAVFRICQLKMFQAAKVRPWKEHTL
jgi:hypothetical protein